MNIQTSIDTLPLLTPPPARRSRARWLPLLLGAVALVAAGFLGWRYGPAHPVPSEHVIPGDLAVEVKGPGTLTALTEARVSSRIQARIEQLLVDRNDRVARGDVLARLAFDDLAGELAAAQASAEASERAVRAAEADRDHALATLDKARAAHERQHALFARGVASQATLDDAQASLRQAEADRDRAERSIEKATAEREAARAHITVARTQLDDSVLAAPIAGVVVSRAHQMGDLLTPGAELLRIVDPAGLVLTARLDESTIGLIRPGQAVEVTFGPGEDAVTGHVLRLGRQVDEETREFEVDIALDRLPANWALGQRGSARVTVDRRRNVLSVPQAFLERRDGRPGLWVAKNGRARWRAVVLGAVGRDRVEIVDGLAPGDVVLAPSGLYPFMRVTSTGTPP